MLLPTIKIEKQKAELPSKRSNSCWSWEKIRSRESFAAAYKYANSYEFEVKSQIEIAKTFDGKADSYEEAMAYLDKITKKGTYASGKWLYYASGLVVTSATKDSIADSFSEKH